MKKMYLQFRNISLIIGLNFIFFGCSQNDEITSSKNNSNLDITSDIVKRNGVKYTGEEIIQGLFFFSNGISDGIPQLAQIKSKITYPNSYSQVSNSMNELSEISINFIKLHYPTFLNELQTTMYSGNLYEIGNVLEKAAIYIEQAGLSTEKYQSAFLAGKKIADDEILSTQISQLDLSTPEGMNQLNTLMSGVNGTKIDSSNRCVAFAGAAAVFYVAVAAVSIAVAAYSVYFKVAYWGPRVKSGTTIHPLNIYTSNGGVDIERDIFISQIGQFFTK